MLIGGVIDDQLDHHLHAALVGGIKKAAEVVERAVAGMDVDVIGDVVAVVPQRRREKRQQPEAGDAEILQIVELCDQPGKIADAVVVAVAEGLDMQLIDDRVLVPERIGRAAGQFRRRWS